MTSPGADRDFVEQIGIPYDPARPRLNYGPGPCPRCGAPAGAECDNLPEDDVFDAGKPDRERRARMAVYWRSRSRRQREVAS